MIGYRKYCQDYCSLKMKLRPFQTCLRFVMNFKKIGFSCLFAYKLGWNRLFSNRIPEVYNRMYHEHFSVCFPDKTVHFTKINDDDAQSNFAVQQSQNVPIAEVSWSTNFLKNTNEIFIISSSKSDIHDSEQHSYIQSCLDLNGIFRSCKNNPSFCLGFTNVRLDKPNRCVAGGHYSRILCALFNDEVHINKLNPNSIESCKLFKLNFHDEKSYVISLTALDSSNVEAGSSFWKLYENSNAAILKGVCDKEELSPVYHDVETALGVLNKYKNIPEVEEVINIYNREIEKKKKTETQKLKFPFIVIEGLDAAGKSTLTETLERKLRAIKYCTPPPVIQHLRKYFVSLPEILARAYYQLGNYIVAQEILEECQHRPVIMDRYWHSTAAYGIANESSLAELPEKGHPCYNWPSTLLKPSLILFLSVTESTRQHRMIGRAGQLTFEEKALDSDLFFRKRLYESYKRMNNPCCIEIDANGSVESVQDKAIAVLKEHNINSHL